MTKVLESLLFIKTITQNYLEFLSIMSSPRLLKMKDSIQENLSTLTEAIARLIKYEEVLKEGKRFTLPHPEEESWHVTDALDSLACMADLNPNDIVKFPLWDLLKEEEKLAKLEDIYEEAHSDGQRD